MAGASVTKTAELRALKRITGRKHQTTAAKETAELNQYLNSLVSTKTFRRELNKAGYHGRATIRKPLFSTINIQKRLKWCRDHTDWSADQWKQVIFSDESSFLSFPNCSASLCVEQHREACNPDCFLPTVKHGGGSVMVWAAISCNFLGPIVSLHGRISSKDYLNILGDHVPPIVQVLFHDGDIFRADNAPIHIAHII